MQGTRRVASYRGTEAKVALWGRAGRWRVMKVETDSGRVLGSVDFKGGTREIERRRRESGKNPPSILYHRSGE